MDLVFQGDGRRGGTRTHGGGEPRQIKSLVPSTNSATRRFTLGEMVVRDGIEPPRAMGFNHALYLLSYLTVVFMLSRGIAAQTDGNWW